MRRVVLVVVALAAVAAPAYAGGDFTDVAAGPNAVWVTGPVGVDELDASTGRDLRQIVVGPAYPMAVAVAGGAAWVAAVDQGSAPGTEVTRIDARNGSHRMVLRRQGWPEAIVVAGGTVWAGFGTAVARFDLDGRLLGVTPIGRPGWVGADASGAWFCCRGRTLMHVDANGRLRASFALPLADPIWAGDGSLWLNAVTTLDRIDERTGRILARIPVRSVQDVAFSNGVVYALGDGALARIDAATNRVLARRLLPGTTQAVSTGCSGVWVTSVGLPGPPERVFRLNPRTLAIERRTELY